MNNPADPNLPRPQDPAPDPSPPPPKKRRWGRRIAVGLLVVVLLLLGLVALAPTIASTGFARSIIERQVGGYINGSAEIDSASFGWFSGQQVGGVKVYDQNRSLVLEVNRVETDLTLVKAVRGDLSLGNTLVDVNLTRLQVDPQGRTNYEQLLKESALRAKSPGDQPAEGGRLPDVSGRVTIKYRGTVEYVDRIGGSPLAPPLIIEPGEAVVTVTDINQAIDNTVRLALRLGDKPAGSVDVAGKIDLVEDNRIDLSKLAADQSVKLAGIDFSALTPLLRIAGVEGTLTGLMNGQLLLKADGLAQARADGELTIADFSAADFPQLAGDTFRTARVAVPIKVSRSVVNGSTTLLKVESLKLDMPELMVAVAGEVTEQSLENVAAGRPPGADGWLHNTVAVRDVTVANRLRRALRLQEGVQVTGGVLSQTADLTFRRDKLFAKAQVDAQVDGTRGGQAIQIAPISATLDATYTPAVDPVRGVSDVSVLLTSAFASMKGGGVTLDKLDFTGDFDLGRLQDQAAQFVDLGGMVLRGTGTFALGTRGDLQKPDSDVAANVRADLNRIDVRLPDQPPIAIGAMSATMDSVLRTDSAGGIARVGLAKVNVVTGDTPADKVLELVASATGVDLSTSSVERFEVSNLAIGNLPKVQRQFGAFVPALAEQQITVRDGQAYANVAGSFDGKTRTLVLANAELSTPNLTVARGETVLLNREKVVASAAGNVVLGDDATAVDLSKLSLAASFVSLAKGEPPLRVRLAGPAVTGNGQLKLSADLAKLSQLAQAAAGPQASPPSAQVRSGRFDGTIDLAGGAGAESTISLAGVIDALTVAAAQGAGAMNNERVAINAQARTAADLSVATATASIDSGFAKVTLTQAELLLGTAERPAGTYDMLRSAKAEVRIPDLPKLYALANAFAPAPEARPTASTPTAAGAAEPAEPLQVTGGAASLTVDAARSGPTLRVSVPDLRVTNLALARGADKYAFDREKPITIQLAAEIDAAGDELRGARVTQLAGDLRVAQLAMPKPIAVNLAGGKPSATGAVKLTGNLGDAEELLAVLGALPPGTTVAGAFAFDATAATAGDVVTATVGGGIEKFQLRQSAERGPLPPRRVTLDGAVKLDTAANVLSVDRFALKLPENDTLAIDLAGGTVNLSDLLVRLDGTKLQYAYDLEQLWPLALPLLDAETQQSLADTKVKGKLSRTMALRGAYAAAKPFNEAIAGVSGEGAFDVELLDSQGMVISGLSIPFTMDKGVVKIAEAKPAGANNGTLNLAGITVDLTTPSPRLSGPRKQRLLHNVSINPALGNTLGKYVNPSFPNSDRARGLLDVTIDQLDKVALGAEMFTENSGRARIVFSITDMELANPLGELMFGQIANVLKLGGGGGSRGQPVTFQGEIRDAVVTLEKGRTTQQLTMTLTEDVEATDPVTGKTITAPKNMPMSFSGDIRLSDLSQRLSVSLPSALVGRFIRVSEKDMLKIFPDGVPIALRGTTTKPEVDLGNLAQRFVEGQLRSRITGDGAPGDNPLEDLLRGVGGQRDRGGERPRDERPVGPARPQEQEDKPIGTPKPKPPPEEERPVGTPKPK